MKCPNCNQVLYSDTLKTCPFCGKEISQDENTLHERKPKMFDIYGEQRGKKWSPVEKKSSLHEDVKEERKEKTETVRSFEYKPLHVLQADDNGNGLSKQENESEKLPEGMGSPAPDSPRTIESDVNEEKIEEKQDFSGDTEGESEALDEINIEEEAPKKKKSKRKISLFSKRKPKSSAVIDDNVHTEDFPQDKEIQLHDDLDTNYDGYYDDLIPEVAKQINKIPQENLIKCVFIVIFMILGCIVILTMS